MTKKSIVIHPFLFAIFPILFLFFHNIGQVLFSQIWMPIAIVLGFTFGLLLLASAIFRDIKKAGIVVSMFLVLFFSYGHALNIMQGWGINRPIHLLAAWCILIVIGIYYIKRTRRNLQNLTNFLNIVATCLIIISLCNYLRLHNWRDITASHKHTLHVSDDKFEEHKKKGLSLFGLGEIEKGIYHFRESVRINPNHIKTLNTLAWILATTADIKLRDPNEAIKYAERACELSNYDSPVYLDTLAAAYAAAGRFPEAIIMADEALKAAPDEWKEDYQNHLDLYEAGKSYVQSPLENLSEPNTDALETKIANSRQHNITTDDAEGIPLGTGKITVFPDIYYIILDGYARQDVLKEIYDYDNEEFINNLIKRGFYVADKSVSNYPFTQLSLACSLNFQYLDYLANVIGAGHTSYYPLLESIQRNRTSRFLERFGYESIFVLTSGIGFEHVEQSNFFNLKEAHGWSMNPFNELVLHTTPIPYIFKNTFDAFDFHRKQVLYAFDKLVDISKKKGRFFVLAHIVKPHVPFVFGENGEPISPHRQYGLWYSVNKGMDKDEYIELYKKQLSFINKKVMAMVDEIISNSSDAPIIVLQSDHGSSVGYDPASLENTNVKERFPILNAYYLPNGGQKYLYSTISPVNTFRLILNHYFGAEFALLADESYYTTARYPYRFYNVTERVQKDP